MALGSIVYATKTLLSSLRETDEFLVDRKSTVFRSKLSLIRSWLAQNPSPAPQEGLIMTWHEDWTQRQYYPGSVVRAGLWTMIANTITSDPAEPVLSGSPVWSLPDSPAWSTQSPVTSLVASGIQFTAGDSEDMVLGGRFEIPVIGATLNYRIILREVLGGGLYRDIVNEDILPLSTGWHSWISQGFIFDKTKLYQLLLLSSDTTSTSDFSGPWDFNFGTANVTPTAGQIYNKTNENLLRVHQLDDNMADRSAELDVVIGGTRIEFANGAAFTVDSTGISGDPLVYNFYGNFTGFPASNSQTVIFKVPIDAATSYVELPGWWTSNPPPDNAIVQGMISTGGAPYTFNDNAYGVDLLVDSIVASPDWSIVSLSQDLTP